MDKLVSLKVENLKKSFRKKQVVRGVSFEVPQNKIIGLLGPNGAGKTTTFYMIVGLERPSEGLIFLGEENITHLMIHQRALKGINYLSQDSSIFRKMSVLENLLAILEMRIQNKQEQKKEAQRLMELLKITHIQSRLGYVLSGGERRRVEIARALATNPKFLLLDEPFTGIDPVTIEEIQVILATLVKNLNVGIIITDHNARETLRITDYSYILVDGLIFEEGTPDDIIHSSKVKQVYLGEHFEQ